MSNKRLFCDSLGAEVFHLDKRLMSMSFEAIDAKGKVLFAINRRFSFGTTKVDITFNNLVGDGRTTIIQLRGDWASREVTFALEKGPELARVSRDSRKLFSSDQMYSLVVAPR